jgi:hypothetical protein
MPLVPADKRTTYQPQLPTTNHQRTTDHGPPTTDALITHYAPTRTPHSPCAFCAVVVNDDLEVAYAELKAQLRKWYPSFSSSKL